MSLLSNLFYRVIPAPLRAAIQCSIVLESQQGHFLSVRKMSCLDQAGNPLPWYTYPAIEYLRQLDFSDKKVFEYGSGNSTLFWSSMAQNVVSVESDKDWFQQTLARVKSNVELKLLPDQKSYVNEINTRDPFDVIVVDGLFRRECAEQATRRLKPGGLIILDNSDWYVKTAKLLRDSNLIQVDMTGFGPINPYTWTTSFFLHREFAFQSKHPNQPNHGVGSLKQYASE